MSIPGTQRYDGLTLEQYERLSGGTDRLAKGKLDLGAKIRLFFKRLGFWMKHRRWENNKSLAKHLIRHISNKTTPNEDIAPVDALFHKVILGISDPVKKKQLNDEFENLLLEKKSSKAAKQPVPGTTPAEKLDLSNNPHMDDAELAKIVASMPNLTHINLSNTKVTQAGLASLKNLPLLHELILSGPQFGAGVVKMLAPNQKLRMLALSKTQITDADLADLKDLKITHLDISHSPNLTEAGLKNLKIGVPGEASSLNLTGIRISVNTLEELKALKDLEALEISLATHTTDEDLEKLKAFQNLKSLDLSNCSKINTGFNHLTELTGLEKLNVMGLELRDYFEVLPKLNKLNFLESDKYTGGFAEGKLHGKGRGTLQYGHSDRYTGDLVDGIPEGKGKRKFHNGEIYDGNFVKGKPEGEGRRILPSGEIYYGIFVKGILQGQGKKRFVNDDVLECNFVDGIPEGKGKKTFANGDVYDGDFVNDLPEGKGQFTYINGDVAEGYYDEGKKFGDFKVTFANGNVFEGWIYGEFSKKIKLGEDIYEGKLTYPNGDVLQMKGLSPSEFRKDFEKDVDFEYTFANGKTFKGKISPYSRDQYSLLGKKIPLHQPFPKD